MLPINKAQKSQMARRKHMWIFIVKFLLTIAAIIIVALLESNYYEQEAKILGIIFIILIFIIPWDKLL